MALIHKATLTPSKLELLTAWLPTRPWFGSEADVKQAGAYRFDDPAGEVGLEAFILEVDDGSVVHVPLTYRAAPVAGADEFLVSTTEHSVLGTRWVYDGCADPVWVTELARTILTGAPQAQEFVEAEGGLAPREPTATVQGSGSGDGSVAVSDTVSCYDDGLTTVVRGGGLELVVVRVLGAEVSAEQTLTGSWAGGGPAMLAGVRQI